MKLTPRERFLVKVCPEPNGGCWLWRGYLDDSGYGVVRFERKLRRAHRVAWVLFRSDIAPAWWFVTSVTCQLVSTRIICSWECLWTMRTIELKKVEVRAVKSMPTPN